MCEVESTSRHLSAKVFFSNSDNVEGYPQGVLNPVAPTILNAWVTENLYELLADSVGAEISIATEGSD